MSTATVWLPSTRHRSVPDERYARVRRNETSSGRVGAAHQVQCDDRPLQERHLPFDAWLLRRDVHDPVHWNEASELRFDLLDHGGRSRGHNRNARGMRRPVGFRDGEAFDVIAAAGEQTDDARQHAGLIVDRDHDGVGFDVRVFLDHVHSDVDMAKPLFCLLRKPRALLRNPKESSRHAPRRTGSWDSNSHAGRRGHRTAPAGSPRASP